MKKSRTANFFRDLAPSLGLSKATIVHSTYKKSKENVKGRRSLTSIREVKMTSKKNLSQVLPGLFIGWFLKCVCLLYVCRCLGGGEF